MPFLVHTASELFRGISEPESRKAALLCAERRFRQGATIFSRGDAGDSLYILKEGLVRIVSVSDKGAETVLHLLKPGDLFGELLLSEEKRAFTAVAAGAVLVTVISRRSFTELLTSVPTIARNFIRLLSKRLAKVETEFAEFGHTWSYHRLAIVLLDLARDHGVETPSGIRIGLRVTHEDLAKRIGTTRETVTTQMNRFARKGLVGREGRSIVVHVGRLEKFLGTSRILPESMAPPKD